MRAAIRLSIPVLLVAPLILLLIETASSLALPAGREAVRISELLANTLNLVGLTLLLSIPPGLLWAWLCFRTHSFSATGARWTLLAGVFVPLPVFACAWQPVLGFDWPWGKGIFFAASIHALAALPAVVWLIGIGLNRVWRELEEEASLAMSSAGVALKVTLPAIRSHIALAVIWVVLQTTSEITVTDMALVRTFAEEVYTQFVASADASALNRAIAMSLPVNVFLFILLYFGINGHRFHAARMVRRLSLPRVERSGKSMLSNLAIYGLWMGWTIVPVWNLILQASGKRLDRSGDIATLVREMSRAFKLNGGVFGFSFVNAMIVSLLSIVLAVLLTELARKSCWQRRLTTWVLIALAVTPSPVLGFALLRSLMVLMNIEDWMVGGFTEMRPIRYLFYDGPTPAALVWVQTLRFLPFATLIVWPSLGAIPEALRESARIEGASGWKTLTKMIWPNISSSVFATMLMTIAFSLGEISASKIVQLEGFTFSQELLSQMHYGVTSTVAALSLMQLSLLVVLMMLACAFVKYLRSQ